MRRVSLVRLSSEIARSLASIETVQLLALEVANRALADAGYIVVSFDNRGTPAPKGAASITQRTGRLHRPDSTAPRSTFVTCVATRRFRRGAKPMSPMGGGGTEQEREAVRRSVSWASAGAAATPSTR